MALTKFVKVGNISNLSDARYCAGMGADMLGFRVIESQSNYMSPKQFQEIRGWVTGPKIVAEAYGILNREKLDLILQEYRPDFVELGLEDLERIGKLSIPFILSISVSEVSKLQTLLNTNPSHLLLRDFKNDVDISTQLPVLIDLTSIKLEEIQAKYSSYGLALNGSVEISPGLKNYDDLADVLEKLDSD